MYDQLAKIALDVMRGATIPADDNSPRAVIAARQMLHDIAAGKLIVGAPLPSKPEKDPKRAVAEQLS
jgi:hypothetical protein